MLIWRHYCGGRHWTPDRDSLLLSYIFTTHQGAVLITPSFLHFYPFLLFYRSSHWHTVVAVRSKNRSECCYFNLLWPPLLQTFYFNFPLSQLHGWLGPGREWCPPPCMCSALCSTNRKCYTQEMKWGHSVHNNTERFLWSQVEKWAIMGQKLISYHIGSSSYMLNNVSKLPRPIRSC